MPSTRRKKFNRALSRSRSRSRARHIKTKKRHNKGGGNGTSSKQHSVRKSMIKSELKKPEDERDFGVKTLAEVERTASQKSNPPLTVSSRTIKQKQKLAKKREELKTNAPEDIIKILNKLENRKSLNANEKYKLEEYKKHFQK